MNGSDLTADDMVHAISEVWLTFRGGGSVLEFDVEPVLLERLRYRGAADERTAFGIPLSTTSSRNGRVWALLMIGADSRARVVTDGGHSFLEDDRHEAFCRCKGNMRSPLTIVHRLRVCYPLAEEA